MLMALERFQKAGKTSYSIGELYREILTQDDGVFHSKQDISMQSSRGCSAMDVPWPLVPRQPYQCPPLPAQYHKLNSQPAPAASYQAPHAITASQQPLAYPGQTTTLAASYEDAQALMGLQYVSNLQTDSTVKVQSFAPQMQAATQYVVQPAISSPTLQPSSPAYPNYTQTAAYSPQYSGQIQQAYAPQYPGQYAPVTASPYTPASQYAPSPTYSNQLRPMAPQMSPVLSGAQIRTSSPVSYSASFAATMGGAATIVRR